MKLREYVEKTINDQTKIDEIIAKINEIIPAYELANDCIIMDKREEFDKIYKMLTDIHYNIRAFKLLGLKEETFKDIDNIAEFEKVMFDNMKHVEPANKLAAGMFCLRIVNVILDSAQKVYMTSDKEVL